MKLQEAADAAVAGLSANDICARLRDSISDHFRGSGDWGYYVDHFGDAETGDVIYSSGGDTFKAPYEMSGGQGTAATCVIEFDSAVDVVPRTIYEPEADEADHYATMEAALKRDNIYTALPLYERFISKSERDAASADDFAGKGKSFPILKPGDISAAVSSIGRAGSGNLSSNGIKAKIIAIAKRKGWTKYLPKAWQADGAKESRPAVVPRETRLSLVESAHTSEAIRLVEARADYEIKLIAPGKGSTAFYPAEVLKRDGPKVFKAGTHVYLNHPTAAEEAARPEGDVANLAGVLSSDAVYHEAHAKGPGLFARMKVFADHAQMVEEKAPHVGMSIRAFGQQEAGKSKDGVPILKELLAAESVDVVTRAGAGGLIIAESDRPAPIPSTQENEMDTAAFTALQESNRKLLERALRADAREEGARILDGLTLQAASKVRVIETVLRSPIPVKDGELDLAKLTEAITLEAKREGQYVASLTGSGRVTGMGAAAVETDPAKVREAKAQREAEDKELREAGVSVFTRLCGGDKRVGELAASKGEAA